MVETEEEYNIDTDKKFWKITCINPTCKKIFYLQTPNISMPVQCFKCGSKWVARR